MPSDRQAELERFVTAQRWFAGKARTIARVSAVDRSDPIGAVELTVVEVDYADGGSERYFVPLLARGSTITDAIADDAGCRALLAMILDGGSMPTAHGTIQASVYGADTDAAHLAVTRNAREQSNSCVMFGTRYALKVLRRLEAGANPELEISRFLAGGQFTHVPPLVGTLEYCAPGAEPTSLILVHGFVPNDGTAWDGAASAAAAFIRRSDDGEPPWQQEATTLGRRTAELHAALADGGRDAAFAPEPFDRSNAQALADRMGENAHVTLARLSERLETLSSGLQRDARTLLEARADLDQRIAAVAHGAGGSVRTRVHGDYHLGQVLAAEGDFVIIDFEGEPTRSLDERRAKQSPLKDVAGMLRSFSYAANVSLMAAIEADPPGAAAMTDRAHAWESAMSAAFLEAYRAALAPAHLLPSGSDFDRLLDAFVLEKVLYELDYELSSRPHWIGIPLRSLLALMKSTARAG